MFEMRVRAAVASEGQGKAGPRLQSNDRLWLWLWLRLWLWLWLWLWHAQPAWDPAYAFEILHGGTIYKSRTPAEDDGWNEPDDGHDGRHEPDDGYGEPHDGHVLGFEAARLLVWYMYIGLYQFIRV